MSDYERKRLIDMLDIIIQPGEKTIGQIADHLLANGVTVRQSGRWFYEKLPTPENAKNTTMEHYRYVCPFCGRRNGKKREKHCADCGAILR